MSTYVIDTETTGHEPLAEVIELAWKQIGGGGHCERFKPTKQVLWGALAVHHILPEELETCRSSSEAKLPADTQYIIGHNIDYDWTCLGKPQVKRICTLAIARALYPELDSHKLGAMYYALAPDLYTARQALQNAHSAAADVMFCYSILGDMLAARASGISAAAPEALWAFSEKCRIPTRMTFGKHKGTLIKDLPRDYTAWMLKQPDMDEYVLKAVRHTRGV